MATADTLKQVSQHFCVSVYRVRLWKTQGCPGLQDKPYDLDEINLWRESAVSMHEEVNELATQVKELRSAKWQQRDSVFWIALVTLCLEMSEETRGWISTLLQFEGWADRQAIPPTPSGIQDKLSTANDLLHSVVGDVQPGADLSQDLPLEVRNIIDDLNASLALVYSVFSGVEKEKDWFAKIVVRSNARSD